MEFSLQHTYKIKIINPSKKSDVVVRHLHDCYTRFESSVTLHAMLIERFGKQVTLISLDVGYYEGSQHSKIWLYSASDLEAMYQKYPGDITLWCDGYTVLKTKPVANKKRCDSSGGPSKRQKMDDEVDVVFKDLKEKHGSNFSTPQLRMWAHMVSNNLHDDLKEPPNIPAFSPTPKRSRQPWRVNLFLCRNLQIVETLISTIMHGNPLVLFSSK